MEKNSIYFSPIREVAQPGSAPVLGTGGRRFKSCLPDHFLADHFLADHLKRQAFCLSFLLQAYACSFDMRTYKGDFFQIPEYQVKTPARVRISKKHSSVCVKKILEKYLKLIYKNFRLNRSKEG